MANLPINKRILNIFLEAATLESLLRWLPNLAGLCLTTYRAFLSHEKCKIISESFLYLDESGQELKKTKNVAFGSFLILVTPSQLQSPPKFTKRRYYSFQEVLFAKTGQNQLLISFFRWPWFDTFQNIYTKDIQIFEEEESWNV